MKKLSVVLMLIWAAIASAAAPIHQTVRDQRGMAISGASVYVYRTGTTTLATLYVSKAGTTTTTNPTTTNSSGDVAVYVDPGLYDLKIMRTGITTKYIYDVLAAVPGDSQTGVFNVRDYGALGDYNNDDTAELQAALDAAAVNIYAEVVIPEGLYKITGQLTVRPRTHITIRGAGSEATRLLWTISSADTAMVVEGWYAANSRSVTITDLGMMKNIGSVTHGLVLLNCSRSTVSRCYIFGFTAGAGIIIDAQDNKKSAYNKITDSYIASCETGIMIDHTATTGTTWNNGNSITNCSISSNSDRGIALRHTGGMSATLCAGHSISDSWIDGKGIYLGETMAATRVSNINVDGSASDDAIGIGPNAGWSLWSNLSVDGGYADSSGAALFTNCRFSRTDYNQLESVQSLIYLRPMSATPDTVGMRGLIYFDKTTSKFRGYIGGSWVDLH